MRFQQVAFAGTASKFAKHVLYCDSGSLEYRFSHHDPGLLFNVVLPIHTMIVPRCALNSGFDGVHQDLSRAIRISVGSKTQHLWLEVWWASCRAKWWAVFVASVITQKRPMIIT